MPVATMGFTGGYGRPNEWGLVAAGTMLYVLSMFLVIALLQKYIVRGLTFGAVRG